MTVDLRMTQSARTLMHGRMDVDKRDWRVTMMLMLQADNGRALDLLAQACERARREGFDAAISWTYHMQMSAQDRLDFDCFLVRMKDELAYQAGTPESRFRERVRRMIGTVGEPMTKCVLCGQVGTGACGCGFQGEKAGARKGGE